MPLYPVPEPKGIGFYLRTNIVHIYFFYIKMNKLKCLKDNIGA
jgi:hypothetical protein